MNKLQDIKQPDDNGRSIRRIQIEKEKPRSLLSDRRPPSMRRERRVSRWGMWIAAIVAVLVLFFAVSVIFTGATVKVHPKQSDISVSGEFVAYEEPVLDTDLAYDVMTVEREVERTIPASGEELVEEKASGQIVIYNNFSSSPEKLIKNTRFETPDGLIYRIQDAVNVPGRKEVNGEVVPGQLEVTVYADEPGEKYNIGLVDFTIPGLKGDSRFDKMFARSKTTMTGGFAGSVPKPNESDLASAREEAQNALRSELLSEANSVKPEGFVFLDKAYNISFEERVQSSDEAGMAKITITGVLNGYLFDENNLAKHLAENLVSTYDGNPVELEAEENLIFETDADLSRPESIEELAFRLSGGTKIVWVYDEEVLKESLKGVKRGQLDSILMGFSSIREAQTKIQPFWRRSMPDNVDDIKIQKIVD